MNIHFFFVKVYTSWQRGFTENYNRLVRQYIPKKFDFDYLSDDYVHYVEQQLNNRLRKKYGYLSPNQKFLEIWNKLS